MVRTINKYRISHLIGSGGFGAVYKAMDLRYQPARTVALKETLHARHILHFQEEFVLLRELVHENLPRYFDMFDYRGNGYLVMEYIEGQNLSECLAELQTPFSEAMTISVGQQLCTVAQFLHTRAKPIIHRDIKPDNIRQTKHGRIKLVDFGIAKAGLEKTQQSRDGWTPFFAPPEQLNINGSNDTRSDIYSIGATLYHLLTRQIPSSPSEVHLGNYSVSGGLARVVMKAMAPHPENRYQSANAMLAALRNLDSVGEIAEATLPPTSTSPVGLLKGVRAIGTVALLLALATSLALTAWWGQRGDVQRGRATNAPSATNNSVGVISPTLTTISASVLVPKNTATFTPTSTPIPSYTSSPTATATPTPTRTFTRIPPSPTSTRVPPSPTRLQPTATFTAILPSRTRTPVPPSPTRPQATQIPISTASPTSRPVPTSNSISNISVERIEVALLGARHLVSVDYTYMPAGRQDVRIVAVPYLATGKDVYNEGLAGWFPGFLEESSGTATMTVDFIEAECVVTEYIEIRMYELPDKVFFSQRLDFPYTWCE